MYCERVSEAMTDVIKPNKIANLDLPKVEATIAAPDRRKQSAVLYCMGVRELWI